MAGPFTGYFAPGVTTTTNLDPNVGGLLGNIRVPALIGVSDETKTLQGYEMVRGSSASQDNKKAGEDVSGQFTGTEKTFTVQHYPIVIGDGTGTVTNNPADVTVRNNGDIAIISRVVGLTGEITLALAPGISDVITVDYFYKKTDTRITDEDLSVQVDGTTTTFFTAHKPIVDGSNAGRTTTNVTYITVKVNNAIETVTHLDGAEGSFTLTSPPGSGDILTVSYYFNQHANTADDLPVAGITRMINIGYSPETPDFIENIDFAIIDDQIQWGTGYKLVTNVHTTGGEFLDDEQIIANLIDDKIYNEDVSSQFTGTENFLNTRFTPLVDGTGRDIITADPSHVIVKVNGSEVDVRRVEGDAGKITLVNIPGGSDVVTVTYWRSRMEDDTYTIECVTTGAVGVGTYKVTSEEDGRIGAATPGAESVASGSFTGADYTTGPTVSKGFTIDETVTLTFTSATHFSVTSDMPSGSSGFGRTDETYVDDTTGLIFTLAADPLYANADYIEIDVVAEAIFVTSVIPITGIPGLNLFVNNTTDVPAGDSVDLIAFDKSGKEPNVGELYYVTYQYTKQDFSCQLFRRFTEITNEYGNLRSDNPLVLASYLMLLNGANAVIMCQVERAEGSEEAADASYLEVLERLEKDVNGINPAIIFPVTSSQSVIVATSAHCSTQSSKRKRKERISFFSYAVGTEPLDAANFAESINSERMISVYPDGAVMEFVDAEGKAVDQVVEGTYIAAALVGVNVNNAFDVATPMTRKQIIGFKQLIRSMDETTADMVANRGVTIIENVLGVMRVRHALTTRMESSLTREINITTIKDFIQQEGRRILDPYIGRKFLVNLTGQVATTLAAMLRSAVEVELIIDFKGVTAERDSVQPDFIKVQAFYQPVIGLNWIDVTFNLRTRL